MPSQLLSPTLWLYILCWLGNLGQMEEHQILKQLLFGELRKKRPSHGTKKRQRDGVMADTQAMRVGDDWYVYYVGTEEISLLYVRRVLRLPGHSDNPTYV